MKVVSRQRNSKMCVICGLDNSAGVRAAFYNMEDGSCVSPFRFRPEHQSYPGRVHGGISSAMIDEFGIRALWSKHDGDESIFGVTMSLEIKYRRPVPYDADLFARGVLVKEMSKFFVIEAFIYDAAGLLLVNGRATYLKLSTMEISGLSDAHEEMPYALPNELENLVIPGVIS